MKQLNYIAIFGIIVLNSCSSPESYQIIKKFNSITDNKNCKVEYYYPSLIFNDSTIDIYDLNGLLEKYVDYQHYMLRCDENKAERIIKGDYQITLNTKKVLSIEYITQVLCT